MRTLTIMVCSLLAACSTQEGNDAPEPALREHWRRAHTPITAVSSDVPPSQVSSGTSTAEQKLHTERDEAAGLLEIDETSWVRWQAWLAHPEAFETAFLQGVEARDAAAIAWLRSSEVAAARAEVEARRARHEQAAHLATTVAAYRRYEVDLASRIGPGPTTRDDEGEHHPHPAVLEVTGERIRHDVDAAWHALRGKVLASIVETYRTLSSIQYLVRQRVITEEQIALWERLEPTVRNRVSVNLGSLGDLLAVQAEVARARTQSVNLTHRLEATTFHLHSLLRIANDPTSVPGHVSPLDLTEFTLSEMAPATSHLLSRHPALAMQDAMVQRMHATRRLLELTTLPRPGLDAARMRRTTSGETAIEGRGNSFRPSTHVPSMPFFGVREAALREVRARERESESRLEQARIDARDAIEREWVAYDEAHRQGVLLRDTMVPLANEAYDAVLGAYDGNRARFVDVLQAARRVLDVRLESARREHETQLAFAQLTAVLGMDPRMATQSESPR